MPPNCIARLLASTFEPHTAASPYTSGSHEGELRVAALAEQPRELSELDKRGDLLVRGRGKLPLCLLPLRLGAPRRHHRLVRQLRRVPQLHVYAQ